MLGRAPGVMHPAILITAYPTVVGNSSRGEQSYWVTQVDKAIAGAVPLRSALVWCAERFGRAWRGGGMALAPSLPTQTAGAAYLGMAPWAGLRLRKPAQLGSGPRKQKQGKGWLYPYANLAFLLHLPNGHAWFYWHDSSVSGCAPQKAPIIIQIYLVGFYLPYSIARELFCLSLDFSTQSQWSPVRFILYMPTPDLPEQQSFL